MSIEAKLDALIEALAANTAQLTVLAANHERLIAGQQAAIDKIETPKATRTRKPKEEEPAGNAAEAASTGSAEAAATAVVERSVSDDDVKKVALQYRERAETDAQKKKCAEFMASLLARYNTPKLVGPDATLDDDQRKEAEFFFRRLLAGCTVDLSADYDLDGDPAQAGAAPAEEDDPLG